MLQRELLYSRRSRPITGLAVTVIVLGVAATQVSDTWTLVGIAAATGSLTAPVRWSWPAGAVIWLLGTLDTWVNGGGLVTLVAVPLTTLVTAVVLYTLTRLAVALSEAHTSREHLARAHVDDERSRISRDLHDIIGRTLVTASLRNQTALQLIDRDVNRAREQLEQVHDTIAHGQAQLRGLTSGRVVADLPTELSSTRALCDRLGIACEVHADPLDDAEVSTLTGVVVREAVTNMLKHSNARECQIVVHADADAATVTVTNDGCPPVAAVDSGGRRTLSPTGASGTGLADLRTRVQTLGGWLRAEPVSGDRFQVVARLPRRSLPGAAQSAPVDHEADQ